MTVTLDMRWLSGVFLVWLRVAPLFVLAPVLGMSFVPVRVRVLLGLALAAMLATAVRPMVDTKVLVMPFAFGAAALRELVVGAAMAFGVLAAFATFQFAGRVLDLQSGFGIATLIDPATRGQAPLLGSLLHLVAIAVFFAADGHHMLIRGLAWSLAQFPPGRPIAALDLGAVVSQFGMVFGYGLVLVAPAVGALFLLDAAFAMLGRTMPQMNVFIVSMPIKAVVGLGTLALSARYLLPAMHRVFDSIPAYWSRLLG